LNGADGNDLIDAGGGNDSLDGGAGADTLIGGAGDENYFVDDSGDLVTELAGEGADQVNSSASFTLSANVENLTLTGSNAIDGTGNALANRITGNSAGNALDGGAGSDTLDGGVGADAMTGGDGSDIYYVDNISDVVTETNATAAGGTDTVYSYLANYSLGANVENGRIVAAGAANITGNGLNNLIYAGAGNNVIDGSTGTDTASYFYATSAITASLAIPTVQATGGSGSDTLTAIENLSGSAYADTLSGSVIANVLDGGIGADNMTGGDGSDIYYVRDVGDVVVETNAAAATGGTDIVYSYLANYTLGTNVENGRILATGPANLIGNSLANVLYAGVGDNVLNGGTGTDTVSYAYATLAVTVSLDVSTAQATAGSGSDTLTAIENLTGSNYADALTGSAAINTLDGGVGNDTLTGGLGADRLTGGTGSDSFRFVTTGDGSDTITDFASGTDKIYIVAANFGLAAGAGADLVIDGTPSSGARAFVYNSTTGVLGFDSDGSGIAAATQLATLSDRPVGFNSADLVIGA
jgi:Ca2+-binding RTX toxin-like protein